jgi:three-Cys-motif partner protein
MREAEAVRRLSTRKPFELDLRYFFIDKEQSHLDFLKAAIDKRDFAGPSLHRITFLKGTFRSQGPRLIEMLLKHGKGHRVIFVLDQYGFNQVPMSQLRQVFSTFAKGEVILTFAADWIVDYLSDTAVWERMLSEIGLSLDRSIQEIKAEHPTNWKRIIQVLLHKEIHRQSGASYYTPFFIESVDAHRAYWLIHLSNHPTARDVMTQLHWNHHNHFMHYGKAGLDMLGYTPKFDFEEQGYLTFAFDSQARQVALASLMHDLPRRIALSHDGIKVGEFLASVANETPATRLLLLTTIKELSRERDLEILSPEGKRRRRGVQPDLKDFIRIPPQRALWKPNA